MGVGRWLRGLLAAELHEPPLGPKEKAFCRVVKTIHTDRHSGVNRLADRYGVGTFALVKVEEGSAPLIGVLMVEE